MTAISQTLERHTENDESLLGRVGLRLLARVLHLVDAVASVDEASNGRQVGGSPCPTEEAKAALLGLDSIGVGASERLAQLGVGQASARRGLDTRCEALVVGGRKGPLGSTNCSAHRGDYRPHS